MSKLLDSHRFEVAAIYQRLLYRFGKELFMRKLKTGLLKRAAWKRVMTQ